MTASPRSAGSFKAGPCSPGPRTPALTAVWHVGGAHEWCWIMSEPLLSVSASRTCGSWISVGRAGEDQWEASEFGR